MLVIISLPCTQILRIYTFDSGMVQKASEAERLHFDVFDVVFLALVEKLQLFLVRVATKNAV